jgi:zinc protease
MQVIVVMHHEQPEVTMRLLVRAGAAYDPPGKSGTAALVASLLNQGTTTRGAREIADAIDSIGGALNTGAGSDLTSGTVLVMKDSFDVGMNMLADVIRRPAFAPEEINRQRTQTIQSIGVSLENPDFIARVVLNRLIYGFHPYGFPDSGMPDTIARITREDLREFHRRYFAPNNSILAVVGDVAADEAMAAATSAFGDWPRQAVQPPPLPEPPKPTRRVVVIDKPDSVQTAVRVGQLAIPRKTPDYMAMDQAVRILGGEGSNRLFRVLRSERGLTYSASADLNPMLLAGDITAETDTRTEATGEAVRVIVDEFTRLQRERIGDGELAGAQAYMTGSFPLTIETPDAIARQVVNAVFYDLSLDELRTYRQRATAVTPDDVLRVARSYVQPDRLSMVLVGDAARFKDQLGKAGFGSYELIPLSSLDLSAADLKKR